jgi:2-polyprenyl-3-methyl-5-hydroxy-6-metoxy-1,4-benzoquinol methylase
MVKLLHEKDFNMENYDGFYEHHFFKPLPDEVALNANRIIPRVDWALDVALLRNPRRILDLGCLEGFAVLTVANHCKSVERAVGVDLSSEGIELAKSRQGLVKADTEFIQDTIENFLETTDEKFDMIMLFEVIEHVKDPAALLKLIDRVKADDGVILISTPSFEGPAFGKNDVVNKCHVRLYTMKEQDYEEMTDVPDPETGERYMRKATSMPKQIGKKRIISIGTYSELINCLYS